MPLILSGNVASAIGAGYEVANSCKFDGGSSYLTADSFGTPTSATTCTLSFWVKRSEVTGGSANYICGCHDNSRSNALDFVYDAANTLSFYHGSNDGNGKLVKPARLFRDPAAWTHVVWACDTTQGTAANRIKVYFDGVEDAKATATYPDEDAESKIFADTNNKIGSNWNAVTGTILDGYLAEFVFIDGLALTPSSFGEFDDDSPTIWKPKDVSGLTFGDNGFWLDFEDSSALGNDVSGNNNDFATSGLAAADQATDTPTNNFATLNPLQVQTGTANEPIFGEGNCQISTSTAGSIKFYAPSTIGMTTGKWYAEFDSTTTSNVHGSVGITSDPAALAKANEYIGKFANEYGNYAADGSIYTSHSENSYGNAWTGEIIGVALDLDNNKLYMSLNGTWQDSGDPTSGATGTGAISITAVGSTVDGAYFFAVSDASPSYTNGFDCNFGGCPAGAISSGNADANGYGNFEYAPPSGYYALCTKNLAEFG